MMKILITLLLLMSFGANATSLVIWGFQDNHQNGFWVTTIQLSSDDCDTAIRSMWHTTDNLSVSGWKCLSDDGSIISESNK